MLEGVGRRLGTKSGFLLNIGSHSLNGREHNCLFRNDGDGRFTDVGWPNGAARVADGRGFAILDADGDGRLDVALRDYRMPAGLLRNRGERRHWIAIELVGKRSNRDAVGARLRLRAGEHWQTREVSAGSGYLSAHSRRQHFGLGAAKRVDELEIRWPSGQRTLVRDLEVDQRYRIEEDLALASDTP